MHAIIMKDFGIDHGLVQQFDTSDRKSGFSKRFYGFRKMFWSYLNKLNVPFYDLCCTDAATSSSPVRHNSGNNEYFNGTDWVAASNVVDSATFTTTNKALVRKTTATAVDVTATVTAAQLSGGTFTSTSAAAVNLTLPTATQAATALGAVRGTTFDFFVDNGVGANTVTVVVGTGITASSAVTGGTTLTVASGVVGQFRLYFQSGTTAKLSRIA